MDWHNKQPIYQQVREKITAAILDGHLKEGDSAPSIRQFSTDYHVNPLTVSKAYQLLVDEGVLEKRRGLGMFIKEGAYEALLIAEKHQFINDELPKIKERVERLGLNLSELLK